MGKFYSAKGKPTGSSKTKRDGMIGTWHNPGPAAAGKGAETRGVVVTGTGKPAGE